MVSHTGAHHLILNSLASFPLLGLPTQLINTSITMMSLMPVNAIPLFSVFGYVDSDWATDICMAPVINLWHGF